jgi:hypothetical protein
MTDNDRVKPSKRDFIRNIFGKGDDLGSTNRLRLSQRKPHRLNENAKSSSNTRLTTASLTSATVHSRVEIENGIDAGQYDARDVKPSKNKDASDKDRKATETADPRDCSVDMIASQSGSKRTPVDMWAMADDKLRDDPKKREMIQKYDHLLGKKLPAGSNLEPIGTDERRKQAFDFFASEIQRLNAIDTTR